MRILKRESDDLMLYLIKKRVRLALRKNMSINKMIEEARATCHIFLFTCRLL